MEIIPIILIYSFLISHFNNDSPDIARTKNQTITTKTTSFEEAENFLDYKNPKFVGAKKSKETQKNFNCEIIYSDIKGNEFIKKW